MKFFRSGEGREDRWSYATGSQMELPGRSASKRRVMRVCGNFFLPNAAAETGEGS